MVRKLTDAEVRKHIRAGKRRAYRADDNLYLHVAGGSNMRASWVFRYMVDGKPRTMGLGPYSYDQDHPMVTLDDAREKAWALRRKLRVDGLDPLEAQRELVREKRLAEARSMTFKDCADQFYRDHRTTWTNRAHAEQFPASMKTYVYPLIGDLPVADVDTDAVLSVLRQKVGVGKDQVTLWHAKPETANRVRQRVEKVLQAAKVDGLREGENPARWRGHLEDKLPHRAKLAKVQHHPALPFGEIAGFMADLRAREGTSALALEFVILTAARTGEVIAKRKTDGRVLAAQWREIDLEKKVWTVPAERMKAGREHRVPLSPAALAVLRKAELCSPRGKDGRPNPDAYIFPGQDDGKPLSNMAMLKLLERMNRTDLTVHGFRSTFRDWAAETETNRFPFELVEMALAHTIGNQAEAAYRRGDMLEARRDLMSAWADACAGRERPKVVPLQGVAA